MKILQLSLNHDAEQLDNLKIFLETLSNMDISIVNTAFTIGISNYNGKIGFYIKMDEKFESILKQRLNLLYNNIEFQDFDYNQYKRQFSKYQHECCIITPQYKEHKLFKIQDQQTLFMENLLNVISNKQNNYIACIEISINPIVNNPAIISKSNNAGKIAKKAIKPVLKTASFILECLIYEDITKVGEDKKPNINKNLPKIDTYIEKNFYNISISIGVSSKGHNSGQLRVKLHDISSIFSQVNYENKYIVKHCNYTQLFSNDNYFKLSTDELSQITCLPTKSLLDSINGENGTRNLVDNNVPSTGIVFGIRMDNINVAIPATPSPLILKDYTEKYKERDKIIENLCKTRLTMGLPGSGKSEYLVNLIINHIRHGIPVILIDPKNDTQQRLIESMPEKYLNNIDYIDLGDLMYPPALNIFRRRKQDNATENALLTTSFISYMKKQFDRSWGYNLERMIQMTTDAILLCDIATMNEFYWMLTEPIYRTTIIEILKMKLSEPNIENKSRLKQLLKYWTSFEERYQKNKNTVEKEIEPVMNKIGVFIGNRFMNAIVSQRDSYDFRSAGDNARSTIINIPEGIINAENMSLIAGFVNKAVWMDYQSRDDMPINQRYPVRWIIDEAHTIIDDEFIGIMQKARSRRLGLDIISQTLSSLDIKGVKMSSVICDNCKSKIIFKIGYMEARNLAEEFSPLTAKDLSECPDYHFYGKLLLDNGTVSKPFFARSLPMAKKLRNYDEFREGHHSGKMTIAEIEDDIENRLDAIQLMNIL